MHEARGQLEVVPRRPHGGGHQVAVEVHLERLLDDQLVGTPPQRGAVPVLGQQLGGAAPGHVPRVATRQSGASPSADGWLVRLLVALALHVGVPEHADERQEHPEDR